MTGPTPKVLAIDYGTQRIGLAVSYGSIADPLTVIQSDDRSINYICKVINDYKITKVIVGISENEMARKTQEFVLLLKRFVSIPVETFDETLSTHTVRNKLMEAKKSQNRPVDHLAAAEFLQEWLDINEKRV